MKNFLTTIFFILTMTFSFAQDNSKVQEMNDMKKNTVKAVEYLAQGLKLDPKQRAIFMNAFSEYANHIMKAKEKTKSIAKKPTVNKVNSLNSKKQMFNHVLRFSEKRDKTIKSCLKGRQKKKYDELIQAVAPMTLEVNKKKIKR